MLRRRARCMCPILGIGLFEVGIPLPPRSIGIIGLGENSEIIYGAQSVTGKILRNKDLAPSSGVRPRLIIPFFGCGRQGRGSRSTVIGASASGFRLPDSDSFRRVQSKTGLRMFLSPLRGWVVKRLGTHGLRRGLYSFAASRLQPPGPSGTVKSRPRLMCKRGYPSSPSGLQGSRLPSFCFLSIASSKKPTAKS